MAKNKKQLRKEAFNTGKEIEAMKRLILHRFIALKQSWALEAMKR
jgi:hypothetical protein